MSKLKVGDRVRAIGNVSGYEGPGTVLEVDEGHPTNEYLVRFDSRPENRIWAENDSVRPLLVASIHITTDGKTTHAVLKEGGKVTKRAKAICSPHDEFDFATGARIAFDRLCTSLAESSTLKGVREVKRPAKVGEWVRITASKEVRAVNGRVYRVAKGCRPGMLFIEHPDGKRYGDGAANVGASEYVVLEGYTPEQEKPKYYNGKVVCVDDCGYPDTWTKGRVYVFVDGVTTSDKGWKTSCYKTLEHANGEKGGIWVGSKFIEYKGEA